MSAGLNVGHTWSIHFFFRRLKKYTKSVSEKKNLKDEDTFIVIFYRDLRRNMSNQCKNNI